MKSFHVVSLFFAAQAALLQWLPAQDVPAPVQSALVSPIPSADDTAAAADTEAPDLVPVVRTLSFMRHGRRVTIHEMAPLSAPQQADAVAAVSDGSAAVQDDAVEESGGVDAPVPEVRLLFVSATVYDHQRTLLSWTGGQGDRFTAWSNIDFNLFAGLGEFEAEGTRYFMLMSVDNVDSSDVAAGGIPVAPALPLDGPGYVMVAGDPADSLDIVPVTGLHEIYSQNQQPLLAAWEDREWAEAEKLAAQNAAPPGPPDKVLYFRPGKGSRYQLNPQPQNP